MTALPKPGDRIELLEMPNDPCPIPPGTRGTVRIVTKGAPWDKRSQIWVNWDIDRSLALCVPPDRYRIVEEDSE